MLHFFRKIRRELLANNKTIRYLKYGVGEIILVVIGILIAIQVDNWNEERIAAENNKLLFQKVSDELVENIKNIDRNLNRMIFKDTFYFKVLSKGVSFEDYKASFSLWDFPFYYDFTSLSDDDFALLLEQKKSFTSVQDSILSELNYLYGKIKKNVDEDDKTQHNTQMDLRNKWMNEHVWYSSAMEGVLTDEMIQHALTDPIYRNQLYEMRFREYWITMGMLWFRTTALDIYREIADMLNIEKDTTLVMDINDFDHIKGVYAFQDGDIKLRVGGKNRLVASVYRNESLVWEWNIQPFSKSYIIFYRERKESIRFNRIVFGKNGEVLGLRNFGDMEVEDGERRMRKKIE